MLRLENGASLPVDAGDDRGHQPEDATAALLR